MTIALVSSIAAGSTNGANFTTSAIDTTGADFLVVGATYFDTAVPALAMSDSKGNTYTGLTVRTIGSDNEGRLFYVANPVVGTGHTFTAGGTGGDNRYASIVAAAFSGSLLVSPFDQQNGATAGAATSLATGSITPSENGELLIAGLGIDVALTGLAINSGFSVIGSVGAVAAQHYAVALAYLVQTSAAPINPTWSWSVSDTPVAEIASFKAAPGGVAIAVLMHHYRQRRA